MTCGIYLITNKINGHKYVGQSKDIEKRFKNHARDGKYGKNSAIDLAIQKYGKNNFKLDIIEELPNDFELLNDRERFWIDEYDTYSNPLHYNLTKGGEFGKYGNPMNFPELREKISQKMKGRKMSDETKQKLSEANTGYKHSPDAIEKIREASINRKWSKTQKKRFSDQRKGKGNPMYGKHHSLEHGLKLSKKRNKTGIYRVKKAKGGSYKQGFCWQYVYYEGGKKKRISNSNISDLKNRILSMGLDWIILDENKARENGLI